jgi:transaldolase/glucose-6-phosphate isomerase
VLYVDELIGPHTVNTLPLKTLEAFRDHGRVAATLEEAMDDADHVVGELGALGIDLDSVGEELSRAGVVAFVDSLDGVLSAIESKRGLVQG